MTEIRDFFISYTKADESWATWIAWVLDQNHYSFTIQALDFVPGHDFMNEMRNAIRLTRQTIAVLSQSYFNSPYATAELNAALVDDPLGTSGRLIPVRVQDCAPQDLLAGRIYIELVGKDGDTAHHDLLAGIAAARLGRVSTASDVRFTDPPRFPGVPRSAVSGPARAIDTEIAEVSILYLGVDTGAGLDLKGQAEQIGKTIERSPNTIRFRFASRLDVNTDNIFEILNGYKPHIVHFSGKQNGGNVLIQTATGQSTTVSDLALAGLLQNINDTVKLAIVDTCKSLRCARSIIGTVDLAMGVEGDIYDEDATRFYNVFYDAITAGRSVSAAAAQANTALKFRRTKVNEIPQLVVRDGVDAKKYRFV